MIHIDLREPSKIRDAFKTTPQLLEYGDAKIVNEDTGESLLGERKTFVDFNNSLHSGRLYKQASGINFLLLEACYIPLHKIKLRSGKVITKKVVSMKSIKDRAADLNWKIPVTWTNNTEDTIYWLKRIEKRFISGELKKLELRKPIVVDHLEDKRLLILMSLPGIGLANAKAILEHYGTVEKALKKVDKWGKDVYGIGKGIVANVVDVLRG